MTNKEAVNWIINLSADIGKSEHSELWHYERALYEIREILESAQHWIPVTERLPKNDDWAIVTILDESGDTPYRYTDFGWYLEAADCWIVDAEQRNDVIAWMPLPEPRKGSNERKRK